MSGLQVVPAIAVNTCCASAGVMQWNHHHQGKRTRYHNRLGDGYVAVDGVSVASDELRVADREGCRDQGK